MRVGVHTFSILEKLRLDGRRPCGVDILLSDADQPDESNGWTRG